MISKLHSSVHWALPTLVGAFLMALFVFVQPLSALTPIPTPDPKPGSYGIGATKLQDPPTEGATITTPGNGANFSTSPTNVAGICPTDLLVQVYNNGVMVGSAMCVNGSFSMDVTLFVGINELSATVFDNLEQPGPVSNIVTVNYSNVTFTAFGELITLTSTYGRRSAAAGSELNWPLQLSGGTGPYAFSLDWGDGTTTELKSQSLAGLVTIAHAYKKAGIYQTNVRVTDVNGVSAFLQVIAVANGEVDTSITNAPEENTGGQTVKVLWIPAAVGLALLIPTYWLGRRSQVVTLRNKMLKERDSYKQK